MGWLLNGIDSGGIPMHLIKAFLSAGPIKYFVETGTQGGESFDKVKDLFHIAHTIEIEGEEENPTVYEVEPNKKKWIANSVNVLPHIIESFDGSSCLFWLDAHYSGSEPYSGVECPLIDELRIISRYQNSILIVDDLRLFSGFSIHPLDDRKWPKIADIFAGLRVQFPTHYVTIVDDYIVACPWTEFKDALDKEWRDRFSIRYPSAEEVKRLAYRAAYLDIMKNFDYLKTWLNV